MPPRRRANFGASLTSEQSGGDDSIPSTTPRTNGPSDGTRGDRGNDSSDDHGRSRNGNNHSRSHGGNDRGRNRNNGQGRSKPSYSGPGNRPQGNGNKGKGEEKRNSEKSQTPGRQSNKPPQPSPTDLILTSHPAVPSEEEGLESCFICAEPMRMHAVHPCNHSTCGRCALRLRALYKQSSCVYCKTEAQTVVFTTEAGRQFTSFTPEETAWRDERLGLHFSSEEDRESALQLLLFHCPHVECDYTLPPASAVVAGIAPSEATGQGGPLGALQGWSGLKEHASNLHHRSLCELCISHKKMFTYEHPLYTHRQLAAHSSHEHRKCEFCNQFFYGPDELYKHLRDKHFQCQMCAVSSTPDPVSAPSNSQGQENGDDHESRHRRRAAAAARHHAVQAAAEAQTWYRDYPDLERHFDKKHYLCQDPICRQQQYVVFENEMDYNAHRLREHASSMTAKEKRDALKVDAAFSESLRDTGSTESGGGRSSNTRSRTVPGAAPAPTRNSRRAGFGGHLTESSSGANNSAQDAEDAAQQAFIGLATAVLGSSFSSSKLASMRTGLATYRAGEASAADLAATVWSVVDSGPEGEHPDAKIQNGASLIRELADLLLSTPSQGEQNATTGQEKATALLRAWSDLAASRSSFPALAGGTANASAAGSRYASAAGSASGIRRAVGAVNRSAAAMDFFPALPSTAASVRSTQPNWGSSMPRPAVTASAASASLSARHANVPGTAAHAARHRAVPTSSGTPWAPPPVASSSTPSRSAATAAKTIFTPSGPSRVHAPSPVAFPGLPQKAPTSQQEKWEEKRSTARARVTGSPAPSVWAPNGSSPASSTSNTPDLTSSVPSSKKGKNKKGQTVLNLGSVRR